MLLSGRRLAAIVFAAAVLASTTAAAKPARTHPTASLADQRLHEGQRLMTRREYVQACPKLEESQRLSPRTRTLLLLAECHEHVGSAKAAHDEYQEALARARRETKDRAALARRAEEGIRRTQAAASSASTPPPPASTATAPAATAEPLASTTPPPESPSPSPSPSSTSSTSSSSSTSEPSEPPAAASAADASDGAADERDPPKHTGLVLGLETLFMLYEQPPGAAAVAGGPGGGTVLLSVANGGYDLSPAVRVYGTFGFARNAPPAGENGFAFSNPGLAARYTLFFGETYRLGLHGGVILPFGSGGGEKADVPVLFTTQRARGVYAELFDPNFLTLWLAAELSTRFGGVLASARLEIDESVRTRGQAITPETDKSRLHARLHGGYVVVRNPQIEPFVELRYQTFLSSPAFLKNDPSARDILLGALGVSLRIQPVTIALSYIRPLDPPLTRDSVSMFGLTVGAEL